MAVTKENINLINNLKLTTMATRNLKEVSQEISPEQAAFMAAVEDIKEDLRRKKGVFLLFRKELNPVMDRLVQKYQSR